MNMLFEAAASRYLGCLRVHFHDFMLRSYQLMHEYDQMSFAERFSLDLHHPLDAVVNLGLLHLEDGTQIGLLCFDEFQIGDVGDARLVMGILMRLLEKGVVVVFTSNRPPWEINRSQLENEEFAPLLGLMRHRCEFLCIEAGVDFRREAANRDKGLGLGVDIEQVVCRLREGDLQRMWKEETGGAEWWETRDSFLPLTLGRELHVEKACGDVAQFSFRDLCDSPLGSDDYAMLASNFRLVFISDVVPQMSPESRDVARRFIKLIDALYETGSRLVMRSEVRMSELFSGKAKNDIVDVMEAEGLQFETEVARKGVGATNRLFGFGTLYSGEDETFAFRRAVSRLYEMHTQEYAAKWTMRNGY